MYLPTDQLITLAVVGKLAELLVGELGDYFGAHAADYTPTKGARGL
jgi:hypothetical protein